LRRDFYKNIRREFVKGVELAMSDVDLLKSQRRKLVALMVDGLFDQLNILVPPEEEEEIREELEWTFITAMF
jgi:hypothetical protein